MFYDTECVALARTERNRKVTIFFPVVANVLFVTLNVLLEEVFLPLWIHRVV